MQCRAAPRKLWHTVNLATHDPSAKQANAARRHPNRPTDANSDQASTGSAANGQTDTPSNQVRPADPHSTYVGPAHANACSNGRFNASAST